MIEVLKRIYNDYGFDTVVGISYFNRFINELETYNFSEIFVFQAKRYSLRYMFSFLLSTPSLWIHFSKKEWVEIMSLMNPRPDPLRLHLGKADFADIHFLVKYIRVNAIELFLHQNSFSNLDKHYVIQYCRKNALFLFIDELDLEYLDGHYFISQAEVGQVQSRLTAEGFKLFEFTEDTKDELISYLKTFRYLT